jgi:hypothetical protein
MEAVMNDSSKHRFARLLPALAIPLATVAQAGVSTGAIEIDQVTDTVPCVAESVHVTGAFHFMDSIDFLGNFLFMKSTLSAEGLSGIGLTTGTQYRFVGSSNFRAKFATSPEPVIFIVSENFAVIGQGPAVGARMRVNQHTTITPDGSVAVSFDRLSLECR